MRCSSVSGSCDASCEASQRLSTHHFSPLQTHAGCDHAAIASGSELRGSWWPDLRGRVFKAQGCCLRHSFLRASGMQ